MRTIEVKLLTYNELSQKAKEKALKDYQCSAEYFWLNEGLETIKKGLSLFDYYLKDYSIDLINGYSNIKLESHHYENAVEELTGLRLAKYIYNTYYWNIYKLLEFRKGSKVRRSRIMVSRVYEYTGYCADEIFLDEVHRFIERPDSRNFIELMMDCCGAVISDMCKDYTYQLSEEYFREHCYGNHYEFYEDGQMA